MWFPNTPLKIINKFYDHDKLILVVFVLGIFGFLSLFRTEKAA